MKVSCNDICMVFFCNTFLNRLIEISFINFRSIYFFASQVLIEKQIKLLSLVLLKLLLNTRMYKNIYYCCL